MMKYDHGKNDNNNNSRTAVGQVRLVKTYIIKNSMVLEASVNSYCD